MRKVYPQLFGVYAPKTCTDPEYWRFVIAMQKDRVTWMTFGNSGTSFDTIEDWRDWFADAVEVTMPRKDGNQ